MTKQIIEVQEVWGPLESPGSVRNNIASKLTYNTNKLNYDSEFEFRIGNEFRSEELPYDFILTITRMIDTPSLPKEKLYKIVEDFRNLFEIPNEKIIKLLNTECINEQQLQKV